MKLIDHWREELNQVWSVRAAIFTALIGVADQILGAFYGQLPPVVYSILMVVIVVARVLDQPDQKAA